jgi:hypothetical protein
MRREARSSTATFLAAFLGCSCALIPGVPAGPISAPGVRAGLGYAYAYAPAHASVREPSGASRTLRGNSAMFGADNPSPFVPVRLGLRVAPRPWLDLGLDLGLLESGLQVRGGPLEASRELPWGVELEWRTGLTAAGDDNGIAHGHNVVRLRAEAYPALPFGRSESGAAYGYGVLGLGASTGTQLLSMNRIPDDFNVVMEYPSGPSASALRWETRLEAALGLQLLYLPQVYTLVFLPWLTVQRGGPRVPECIGCTLQVLGIDSRWGFGLALTGYWGE